MMTLTKDRMKLIANCPMCDRQCPINRVTCTKGKILANLLDGGPQRDIDVLVDMIGAPTHDLQEKTA